MKVVLASRSPFEVKISALMIRTSLAWRFVEMIVDQQQLGLVRTRSWPMQDKAKAKVTWSSWRKVEVLVLVLLASMDEWSKQVNARARERQASAQIRFYRTIPRGGLVGGRRRHCSLRFEYLESTGTATGRWRCTQWLDNGQLVRTIEDLFLDGLSLLELPRLPKNSTKCFRQVNPPIQFHSFD